MRFSDIGMVFEEKLCEKAQVLKGLTLPTSFSACARSARQSFCIHSRPFPLLLPVNPSECRDFERLRERRRGERMGNQ